MDIGRGIEIQRLALLRLLAGWLAVVAYLSTAPLAPVCTRWVCSLLSSVLGRAEAAAQCLLRVQTRLLAESRGVVLDRDSFSRGSLDLISASDADEPPSLAELRRRLIALRCLLRNVPRRALRLLRRLDATSKADGESGPGAWDALPRFGGGLAVSQCCPPRPWHPPERVRPSNEYLSS